MNCLVSIAEVVVALLADAEMSVQTAHVSSVGANILGYGRHCGNRWSPVDAESCAALAEPQIQQIAAGSIA
jgi:hypothetical protein